MNLADAWRLLGLAAVWGSSFLFMGYAAPEFGAVVLVELRLAIAAAILVPMLVNAGGGGVIRTHWLPLAVLGAINSALPFSLLAYATLHLAGGFAAVLNGTTPFFAAGVAFAWLGIRLSRLRVMGLVVGFGGVVVLVQGRVSFGQGGDGWPIVAGLAAACSYAVAASFVKRRLADVDSRSLAAGSLFWGAVVLLPVALYTLPRAAPSLRAWWMVTALGVLCTGIAYRLYYRLLENLGPTGAVTVTFLVPPFAMLWGRIFRGEHISGRMAVGAAIVLVGTGLTTGLIGPAIFRRRVKMVPSIEPLCEAACEAASAEDPHPDLSRSTGRGSN